MQEYIGLHMLFHITKLIEVCTKPVISTPILIIFYVCVYVYQPPYVFTYVIPYMYLMLSLARMYSKTGINESILNLFE